MLIQARDLPLPSHVGALKLLVFSMMLIKLLEFSFISGSAADV
jgi:hypothetical protein